MPDFDNTNRGVLFKDDKKAEQRDRDYAGSINIEGTEYWLSAWIKTSKKGTKFLSLSVKPKAEAPGPAPGFNDSIDFSRRTHMTIISDKQRREWTGLDEEDDADRAFDPIMLDALIEYFDDDSYDLESITHARQLRECNGLMWQWCRIWARLADKFSWRWIPVGMVGPDGQVGDSIAVH